MKIILDNVELPYSAPEETLKEVLSRDWGITGEFSFAILRKSLDARDRPRILYRYRIEVDLPDEKADELLRRAGVRKAPVKPESPPAPRSLKGERVVIVGAGPAGLFCALRLGGSGAAVDLFERGSRIEERLRDIHSVTHEGVLNPESNVLFGEGGAGAYSDGKLTSRTNRPEAEWFFTKLVELGAPSSVLYEQRPHLGTDRLVPLLKEIRKRLEENGVALHFGERVTDLISDGASVRGVTTAHGGEFAADAVVLASGHSARDVYPMLERRGVALEKKGFAVGVRAEHPAELIDMIRYGRPSREMGLPPADYFLTFRNRQSGRSVYSFCMCPGGEVINSSSEEGLLCVNGMSYSARGGARSNAALVVSIEAADIPGGPLGGVEFQRGIEALAFSAGGGGYRAPAQRIASFVRGNKRQGLPAVSYRPGIREAPVSSYLPEWIAAEIGLALKSFDRKMRGYLSDEGVLIGVETRTSSPVRIPRGEDMQSVSLRGLYPTGEGAGYAGGIVSSAVDGIRAADKIRASFAAGNP